MAEETVTENDELTDQTTEDLEEAEDEGFDKFRQQIQQELGNKLRPLENLANSVETLAERVEQIASQSDNVRDVREAESILSGLEDLDDEDIPDARTVKSALTGLMKRIDDLGNKSSLSKDDAIAIEKLRASEAGKEAWKSDRASFLKRWSSSPDVSAQYDDLTDAAISVIEGDEDLGLEDLKGIRHRIAQDLVSNNGNPRPRRSTAGTRITRTGASSTASGRKKGDGIERDANNLPMALWEEED